MKISLKNAFFVAFWMEMSTNDPGSKLQLIFERIKLLNDNILAIQFSHFTTIAALPR